VSIRGKAVIGGAYEHPRREIPDDGAVADAASAGDDDAQAILRFTPAR